MTNMRRILVVFSVFVVAVLPLAAAVNRELLALVPPGTEVVASVDVAHARTSTFGRYFLNRLYQDDGHVERFVQETGFDPRQDLQHLLVTTSGQRGRFAVLAEGVFNLDRIKALNQAKGRTLRKYRGADLIVSNRGTQSAVGLAFPVADIAVMGDLATVEAILDGSNVASDLDPAVSSRIFRVGPSSDMWFVSQTGLGFLGNHLETEDNQAAAQKQALQSITGGCGGVRFGDTIDVSATVFTRSSADATSLTDVLRFGTSLFQMQRGNDPQAALFAGVLDRLKLRPEGEALFLSVALTEKEAEQLADLVR